MRSLILGLLLLTADVAEAGSSFFVIGSGQDSCGKFIATIGDLPPGKYRNVDTATGVFVSENSEYQEWLEGFVSGFNYRSGGNLEQQVTKIDAAGLDLWMRNWCNKHPTQTVSQGAMTFINEMQTQQQLDADGQPGQRPGGPVLARGGGGSFCSSPKKNEARWLSQTGPRSHDGKT
jgi:hypothetical protein